VAPRRRSSRRRLAAAAAAATLVLAACDDDEPDGPQPGDPIEGEDGTQEPPTEPEDDDGPDPDEGDADDDGEPDAAAADGDAGADPEGDQVQALAGEPAIDETQDGIDAGGRLAVTDVRVATSQGSGAPIETAGDAALEVAVHGVSYPFDLDEGVEPRDGDTVPGAGGVVTEVVDDSIFEGIHVFVVGLDAEHGYLVDVFDEPKRVVVDIVHDG
jgi:hypothetical protein